MQSFEELIDLASKGNARNVDQYTDEVFKTGDATEDDRSLYTLAQKAKPGLVFCFGKAADGQGLYDAPVLRMRLLVKSQQ